jgi:uncharacterized membrane protein
MHSNIPVPKTQLLGPVVARSVKTGGVVGALIGGAASAAQNIKAVKNAELSKEEAVKKTAKDAAGSGLATAAGTALAGTLGVGGLASLLVVAAAATGVKYLWDAKTTPQKKIAQAKGE